MSGPARGRRRRVTLYARSCACLGCSPSINAGRGPDADPDLCGPCATALCAPQDSPLRRTGGHATADSTGAPDQRRPASRQGRARAVADRPDADLWPARRQRRVGLRLRLAQSHPQETETFIRARRSRNRRRARHAGAAPPGAVNGQLAAVDPAVGDRQQAADRAGDGRHRLGQPPRKRLKVDDDPFGAVGDYVGSFLVKSAVELSRRLRHQSRPHLVQELAVLCGGAGIPRRLRLGAPRAGRRSPRLVHRLWQHLPPPTRRHHLFGADQSRPAGFHRPYRRPSRRHHDTH